MFSEFDEKRKSRLNMFMEGFNTISQALKEAYQCVTLKGDAELELVNSLDPFAEVRYLFIVMSNLCIYLFCCKFAWNMAVHYWLDKY